VKSAKSVDNLVAIGLRAKTARAIAVVVAGSPDAPVILAKTEIKLVDAKIPATAQPYHEVMDLPWEQSQRAVQKSARAIESVATKALAKLVKEQASNGRRVCSVGIVGAKDRELSRIGNPHIRAHAAEGVLFRQVLDHAARANGLAFRTLPEREFPQLLKDELGSKADSMRKKLDEAARALSPPWRADEKLAAAAGWLVLHKFS
jgi:hypothetical protein